MNNIDEFEEIAAIILESLAEAFPTSMDFDAEFVADKRQLKFTLEESEYFAGGIRKYADEAEAQRLRDVFTGTMRWLRNEGYIVTNDKALFNGVLLTSKGLRHCGAVPQSFSDLIGPSA